jgi:hypothetical protein
MKKQNPGKGRTNKRVFQDRCLKPLGHPSLIVKSIVCAFS